MQVGDSFWSAAARWRFAGYGAHGLQSRSDRGTTAISLLHYSTTAFTAPLHCVEDNEPLEHRHACLCAQRAFSLLKGNRLQACLAHRLGSLCSSAPCPDNEPLKNGNQATAYRSSMC